jgi:hypothetical protein
LCERPEPLALDEARLLGVEEVVLVGSVRQSVRSTNLTTRGAGIGDHIRVWKGELERLPSLVSDPPGTPNAPRPPSAGFGFSSGFGQTSLHPGTVNSFPAADTAATSDPDWAFPTKKKGSLRKK